MIRSLSRPALLGTLLALTPLAALAAPLVPSLTQIENKGYEILEVERKGTRIEVEAITADGRHVELLIDPATQAILSERQDD